MSIVRKCDLCKNEISELEHIRSLVYDTNKSTGCINARTKKVFDLHKNCYQVIHSFIVAYIPKD